MPGGGVSGGHFSRLPTTLVPWGLGYPQTLPEFWTVLIAPGWGHPEPAPLLPGGVSVSPRESVHSVLLHKVSKYQPLSWSPSTARLLPGLSLSGSHMVAPQPLVQLPSVVGAGAGAGCPGLSPDVGVRRLSSPLLVGGILAGRPFPLPEPRCRRCI